MPESGSKHTAKDGPGFEKTLYKQGIWVYNFQVSLFEGDRVKTSKREQTIIALLESRGRISALELSRLLGISASTLRKQLADMQERGLLIRTYGGVMSVNRVPDETFESKLRKSVSEKRRIAEAARKLIPAGATVALGSGTTVYGLSMLMDDLSRAVVYSNSMQTADYLSRFTDLEVHICGGIIRSQTGSIIGNEVAEYFRELRQVDYAFIGCDAIDESGEVFSENLSVATAEKNILLCAKHRYILCDSTKLGKTSLARITSLRECDGLITGDTGSRELERYRELTGLLLA